MSVKNYILPVYTDGDYCNNPNFFRISFTAPELAVLAGYRDMAIGLHEKFKYGGEAAGSKFRKLVLWDHQPTFFHGYGLDEHDLDVKHMAIKERLQSILDEACEQPMELDQQTADQLDALLDEDIADLGFQRLDYCLVEIDEDSVNWRACPKHASYECTTGELSWETLGLAPKKE
jgi:hypothetical protein